MKIVIAILIFSAIIIIHELGHFLLAKKNGIGVTEFSVGMGPRIFTLVKTAQGLSFKVFASTDDCMNRADWKDRTKYSLKLLPIGGSCMMLGEDEALEDERAFNSKSVWARISVIFAGPFFNFLLAFVLAMIIIGSVGYDPAKISALEPGYPMEQAGFQVGDTITKINGSSIHFQREISAYLQFNPVSDKEVKITVVRDGEKLTKSITPVSTKDGYKLGLGFSNPREKTSALNVVKYGLYEVKFWITTTVDSLKQLVMGKINKKDLAGPVGIVDMIGDRYEESKSEGGFMTLLEMFNISILLSANLGVMNLLPIPALDGGRLVFLFIEAVRGKPIDREKEGMVHLIGLAALMILMVLVLFNDISRLIHG